MNIVAIANTQMMYFSIFHKLFEDLPYFNRLLQAFHWAMNNKRVKILCFQIFQRYFEGCFYLDRNAIFWIIGDIIWILSVDWGIFSLDEQLISWYSRSIDSLSNTRLIIMLRLTCSINCPKTCFQS